MAKKILIAFAILIGIGIAIFMGYVIMIMAAFGAFDKDYSITELKENFHKRKQEIYNLKEYYNEIVPKDRFVEIEFEDNNTLNRFGISTLDSITGKPSKSLFLGWDLDINSEQMDSLLTTLGWSRITLKTINKKLSNANCIQIESGEPTKIGFQRSGLGMYSFNVFQNPIPDSLKSYYNDSCTYVLAGENLVLEYGGGAVGAQCFYDFD